MRGDRAKRSMRFTVQVLLAMVVLGCSQQAGAPSVDVAPTVGVGTAAPGVIARLHVPLDRVAKVSRFRSGVGHDYSDSIERCRSMKHYFQFTGGEPGAPHNPSWTTVPIVSPLDGVVVGIDEEWAGDQIRIRSAVDPRYTVILFHVRAATGVADGVDVKDGQALGFHASDETMSDLAVEFVDVSAKQGRRLFSAFDVMGDEGLAAFAARGVTGRAALIIGQAERDGEPLVCDGNRFTSASQIADWFELSAPSDPSPRLTPTP